MSSRVVRVLAHTTALALGVGALAVPAVASAHIALMDPAPRTANQKAQPCGGAAKGGVVAVYEPGETIDVTFRETVPHPGHFRVSFDADGEDDFVYPTGIDDFYSIDTVLLDDIPDVDLTTVTVQVTLPDIECENCTLQVVQVMYDKVNSGWGDNDLYFQCADIALRRLTPPMDQPMLDEPGMDATMVADTATPGDATSGEDTSGAPPLDTSDPSDTDADADTNTSTADPGSTGADTALGDLVAESAASDDEEDCACSGVRTRGSEGPPLPLALGFLGVVGLGWAARRRHRA